MSIRLVLLFVFLFVSVFVTGCSKNVRVEGTVTFSDGTTINHGQVVFENDAKTYFGNIREDGSFSIGVYKDGEGIPKGQYRAAVTGVFEETQSTTDAKRLSGVPTHLVAEKYRNSKRSGFQFDIQKKTTDIIIIVEKPDDKEKKRNKKR